MFNEIGQGFEVFKLLISAVIAVVILTLLLSILGIIKIPSQGNPEAEAEKIVDIARQRNASTNTSPEITFRPNLGITNRAISSATKGGLADEQVCVLIGDFQNDNRFQYAPGESVIFTASTEQNAEVIAICDTGSAIAAQPDYFQKYTASAIDGSWVSDCGCVSEEFNQKCCIVALKRYSG